MSLKLELPEGTLLVSKKELKNVIQEVLEEVEAESTEQDIMTIQETAEYLKVSVPTVRSMITNNEIPYFQRGQIYRLNRLDVKGWIRQKSKWD
ncbi:excisionase family DNA-binding protein [Halobacillus salinarum]|uniref:Excisionase family DNA-binding protein n=1 Tax=Halobacillus salinarum TaxID=2932257 RepID=A0ABY4EJG8_9BACI|nr:helix-turn-helix domain-containing protein [Halobacillus salinarum]UOQ44580.1 excisionase family DNA-binding protein [Halobacillus salinarum]